MIDVEEALTEALHAVTPPMPDPASSPHDLEQFARRRRGRRRTVVGGCAIAGVLVAGGIGYVGVRPDGVSPEHDASSVGQRPASPDGSGLPAASPYLLSRHTLRAQGLVLLPPGDERPGVSRRSILARADWGRNQYPGARPVRVVLRLVTDNEYGRELPGGALHRFIDHRLMWVVIVPDDKTLAIGGPAPPPGTTWPPGPRFFRGTSLELIDAHTGRSIVVMEF